MYIRLSEGNMIVFKIVFIVIFAAVFLLQFDESFCTKREQQRQESAKKSFYTFSRIWHAKGSNSQSPASSLKSHRHLPDSNNAVPTTSPLDRGVVVSRNRSTRQVYQKGASSSRRRGYSTPSEPSTRGSSSEPELIDYPPAGPALIDWRSAENYPEARNQCEYSDCNCCWAMAAVSVLEILYSVRHNQRTYLSIQQVMDCTPNTNGCDGGQTFRALQYLVDVGVTLEETYPFVGAKTPCRSDFQITAKAYSYTRIANDEAAIVEALHRGPLVINLDFPEEVELYRSGVANPAGARNDLMSCHHAAVIVGHGEDYWIIRNSYGEDWGDRGHYLLLKGTCGVGHMVYSVTLDSPYPGPYKIEEYTNEYPACGIARVLRTTLRSRMSQRL